MTKLGPKELEIIHLGIKKNGIFNETDLENSELKKLGVGRILDILGELRERDLILIGKDGFTITEKAREYLWGKSVPPRIKLLRLLGIKSYNLQEISKYLFIEYESANKELETLRKQGLVLMSPIWKDSILEKTFEILQEGLEYLDKIESGKTDSVDSKDGLVNQLLSDIQIDIDAIPAITPDKKRAIFEKIQKIRNNLQ